MKTVILFCLGFGCATLPLLSAHPVSPPRIEWQQTIGGTADDWPAKVIEMPDGSFVIGGMSRSGISGNKTSPRLDSELWSIVPDENGYVWIDRDAWVIKLGHSGFKEWDQTYGGAGTDALVDMVPATDGGILIGGTGFRGEVIPLDIPCLEPFCGGWALYDGSQDYFVARTDATGHTLWQQFLGGNNHESLAGLAIGLDNSLTLAGSSSSPQGGNKTAPQFGDYDAWIARLEPSGNKVWDRSFGGTSADQISLAKRTSDGGMILCGVSFSDPSGTKRSPAYGAGDVWLLRLNAAGEKLWEQSLGGTGYESPLRLFETADGGFLIGCGSASPISGNKTSASLDSNPELAGDYWIVRVNEQGAVLWDKVFGTESWDLLLDFQPTANGGAIFSGVRYADPATGFLLFPLEFRLIQIDANGTELWSKVFDANSTSAVGWLWPSRLLPLPDQGVLIGATSFADGTNSLKTSPTSGMSDCWLLRLDSRGDKLWDLSLGGSGIDGLMTLDRCRDGGFIVGMTSQSAPIGANGNKTHQGYGASDIWVVKLGPEQPSDRDGDGVPDAEDNCPNTPRGAVVNASGCAIHQLVPCDGPWKNHGQYVKAIVKASGQFRKAGLISHKQRLAIFLHAVKSDCGTRRVKH
jgi:hypothetical protein